MAELFMIVGFLFAAYAVVANDSIQTLGPFLSSNTHRPWWLLWAFVSVILLGVFVFGWMSQGGDVTYGRLNKFPMPEDFTWILVLPAMAVLVLTRFGIPVSTTFLILTAFTASNLNAMLVKSLFGYGLAFAVGFILYRLVLHLVEKNFLERPGEPATDSHEHPVTRMSPLWSVALWVSTGFLWSQWLIQDLANIFAYLPRGLTLTQLFGALLVLLALLGILIYGRGGRIQHVVSSKTNTHDIRSAALINFLFAVVLLYFKEMSNLPMSTTWVFLGLLAGRELGMLTISGRTFAQTTKNVVSDVTKASLGLVISVVFALYIPTLGPILGSNPVLGVEFLIACGLGLILLYNGQWVKEGARRLFQSSPAPSQIL